MSFFAELKRRNVVRAGAAYAAIGWLVAQLAEFGVDNFGMPVWVLQYLVIALLLGFPVALFLSWRFELTPAGLELDEDVTDGARARMHRIVDKVIIAVLFVAVAFLLLERFYLSELFRSDAVASRESVAVLPFANMSDDSDHFADGLSEELMNLLAKNPDLKVAGRTSSFSFKGQSPNFSDVGQALNVNYVLEGSVRRSDDQLRITAQLIKVDDGFHVWSETYDRQLDEIFAIQDEVANAIARQLRLRLAPPSRHPTENPDAYAIYLESLAKLNFRNEDPAQVAKDLEEAVRLDPGFALAYELMAKAYWAASGETIDAPEGRERVLAAASSAVELDPTLVVARMYQVNADLRNSWVEEFKVVGNALEANPEDYNVINHHCHNLRVSGYLREFLACARRLIELEPLSPLGYYRLAEAQSALRFRDEARASWFRAAELAGADYLDWLYFDSLIAGDFQQAIDDFERFLVPERMGRSDFRRFVENASDARSGKQFLDEQIAAFAAQAKRGLGRSLSHRWYMAFGYMNDFWDAINEFRGNLPSIEWSDAEPLVFFASVWPGAGFVQHPAYLAYAKGSGFTDLWEWRGPPDYCSKISGEWVCE